MKKFWRKVVVAVLLLSQLMVLPKGFVFAADLEWRSTSSVPGGVEETYIDGKRYNLLKSTSQNDNGNDVAIFEKMQSMVVAPNTHGGNDQFNAEFTVVPKTPTATTRFGFFLYYTDAQNHLFVGYDAGGWFYEHKVNNVGTYHHTGHTGLAPNVPATISLLLQDNRITVKTTVSEEETKVIEWDVDASVVSQLAARSKKVVIKLGSIAARSEFSEVAFLSDNQMDLPKLPEPRPVLGDYDKFEKVYDFENGEADVFNHVSGSAQTQVVEENGNKSLRVTFPQTSNIVTFKDLPLMKNAIIEADVTPESDLARFGLALRVNSGNTYTIASVENASDKYFAESFLNGASHWTTLVNSEAVTANKTVKWKAMIEDDLVTLYLNNKKVMEYTFPSHLTQTAGEFGFIKTRGGATLKVDNVKITRIVPEKPKDPDNANVDFDVLTSDTMVAKIDKAFPRVYGYYFGDDTTGEPDMYGQRHLLNTIEINDIPIVPTVTYTKNDEKSATYVLNVKDTTQHIDAVITAKLSVEDNVLSFNIVDVINNNTDLSASTHIIRTIAIPNHSLVSVQSTEENANVKLARMSVNTSISGDEFHDVTSDRFNKRLNRPAMYAFVSNDMYSAGLWSNSQYGTGGANDFARVTVRAKESETFTSAGLESSKFIYRYGPGHLTAKEQGLMPEAKVIITHDENGDNQIDWQDGAIAYRRIMNNPFGWEYVPELVAYRIAMNFGSQAQNPFLTTLDGVKKVALHTDGLGQSILLKGYGSEGHDSGHLDYKNIGSRIGGVKDMKYLLEKGIPYGARFGVHINASETYPESPVFSEALLKRWGNGSVHYGWNWLDQGINISAEYDLLHGRRDRFKAFKDVVGDNLDFIYVDVWGNGQSGDNTAWMSHQLAKEINDQGWRLGGEWGHAFEYDSTFQHWAADLTYGGYTNKGINSAVARFIRNHQKDSWVGNYQSYSGAADFPLLGGYDMKDFEGWQGRNDYNAYILNLFRNNIATKYLQHFTVEKWEDGTPVHMSVYDPNTKASKSFVWTPEMKITLRDATKTNTVVVERKSNDFANDVHNYRSRTIKLNDRFILDGTTYLIPWNWDVNGNVVSSENEKLYHWNEQGGQTTWTLPNGWTNVVLYELTELGKQKVDSVSVSGNQVTINAKAATPYVLYKTEQSTETVEWSEGMHIYDQGFNAQNLDRWNVSGDVTKATITKSQGSNDMLTLSGEVAVSQTITDLIPGQKYAVYVGVDNRSDAKASLQVSANGKVVENYTHKSIAKNYVQAYAHNTNQTNATVDNTSYFQNMYVFFVAPEEEVTLTLRREAGEGNTYFDEIRVFENEFDDVTDANVFTQNFEKVPQGIFPFVVGDVERVNDNRTHLSELHAPFTQRGWNGKVISDVIDGTWSLKTNGLVQGAYLTKMVYQTVPHNVRFEPGKRYKVSFDYELGSDNTYQFVVSHGENVANRQYFELLNTVDNGQARRFETEFVAHESGQSWIGIYSTNVAANTRGTTDNNEINFKSYKDIVLDNLRIESLDNAPIVQNIGDLSITEKVIEPAEMEVPNAYTTEYVDENGAEIQEVVFAEQLKDAIDISGYVFIETQQTVTGVKHVYRALPTEETAKLVEPTEIEIPNAYTTEYVDENGAEIQEVVFAEQFKDAIDISGYVFIETQQTVTGVKHVYRALSTEETAKLVAPTEIEIPNVYTTEYVDENGAILQIVDSDTTVKEAPEIKGYTFVETQKTPTGVKHIYRLASKQGAVDLPDTGSQTTTIGLLMGAIILIGGIVLFLKRKEN